MGTFNFDGGIIELGQGFDSFSGKVRGRAARTSEGGFVRFDQTKLDESLDGLMGSRHHPYKTVDYEAKIVDSSSESSDFLNIYGEAEFNTGGLGGKLSGAYTETEKKAGDKLRVVVKVTATQSVYFVNPLEISVPDILKPSDDSKEDQLRFRRMYGRHFVHAVIIGGELTGMVDIKTNFGETTEDIEGYAEVSGIYSGIKLTGGVGFSLFMKRMTENRKIDITMTAVGGSITRVPVSASDLVEIATEFPGQVFGTFEKGKLGSAVPIRMITRPYAHIPGFKKITTELGELAKFLTDDVRDMFLQADDVVKKLSIVVAEYFLYHMNEADVRQLAKSLEELRDMQFYLLRLFTELNGGLPVEEEDDDLTPVQSADFILRKFTELKQLHPRPISSFLTEMLETIARAKRRFAFTTNLGDPRREKEVITFPNGVKMVSGHPVRLGDQSGRHLALSPALMLDPYNGAEIVGEGLREQAEELLRQQQGDEGDGEANSSDEEQRFGSETADIDNVEEVQITDIERTLAWSSLEEQVIRHSPDSDDFGSRSTLARGLCMGHSNDLVLVHVADHTDNIVFLEIVSSQGERRGLVRTVWPYRGSGLLIVDPFGDYTEVKALADWSYLFYMHIDVEREGEPLSSSSQNHSHYCLGRFTTADTDHEVIVTNHESSARYLQPLTMPKLVADSPRSRDARTLQQNHALDLVLELMAVEELVAEA
ncbi:hypothetical protein NDN08_004679 [Rhodosorus marinus]|uniref:MACPF domain-containing protein n=1 Tax=Rhodosorus marinus TaxID=101924 RepID=A0AAV8ULX9_9RHOD|nr:hypothetical protein NDN08_004679 [Rhodosorus marinus]